MTGFGWLDIMLIVLAVLAAIGVGLYFLNRWASKRYTQQQDMVAKNKQPAQIYVIDKKHDKAANVQLPKMVTDNLPKTAKLTKMYFVKAKIGPQIITLMCDKTVFGALDVKKTFHVELAGIYIVSVKGAKTQYELKQAKKEKPKKAKEKSKKK
ncbi:MAG: hypothetical protein FWE33_01955 [Defluviitaleaceae bacterium]|nr:hypothetical protein [Defluviitaleaceae bacterium]